MELRYHRGDVQHSITPGGPSSPMGIARIHNQLTIIYITYFLFSSSSGAIAKQTKPPKIIIERGDFGNSENRTADDL